MKLKLRFIDSDAAGGPKMEGQTTTNENVVSLFAPRKKAEAAEKTAEVPQQSSENPFEDAIRKNEENRKRMMQERLKTNKGVLKSYRIKN